ncbi:hypothetical protein M2359_000526 [Gordonia amarae]|uniref:VWFA domain-containing protein n=1 Tax=Gordonia amarae NBRC 15530 TaxID=1075090 RepID=G7GUR0_9ACTN|nr:VWA domain-containing protein [Gordonia amarae]MCS3876897.1 hypothetical protein [Gordonia amarae]GAB07335.1 hypothetical protein GOAMR_64_00180 [Gordonia amarae NBRC 15530]
MSPRTRFGAGVAAIVVAFLTTLTGVPLAHAAPEQTGVDRFGSCMAGAKTGRVLLLVDESRSLTGTDPDAARVTAAKFLTEQLSTYAADTGAKLDVAIAGFSDTYSERKGWTRLSKDSLGSLTSTLDGFADRAGGTDTDYWLALDGARKTMRSGDAPSCRMIAWFTDGELDFTIRSNADKPYAPGVPLDSEQNRKKMVEAAKTSLCRPGGLVDQVRSSDIITVAIGLAGKDVKAADFDLLKSIATGEQTSTGPCGDVRSPVPGDFYLADDIDDLLFEFDKLSTPGQPPLTSETGACAVKVCDEGKHRFVLDSSVGSVNILASADRAGLTPVLVSPDGTETRMAGDKAGTAEVGGVRIGYSFPSGKAVSIRMTNPQAGQWRGAWALVFLAPDSEAAAKTRSQIHIRGDLSATWLGEKNTALHSGDTVDMKFGLRNGAGKQIDPTDIPGTASLTTELVPASGRAITIGRDIPKARIARSRPLDLGSVAPGRATLRMTLSVTTASARDHEGVLVQGTALSPSTVELPVTVDPPVGYPKVDGKLDFGTFEGEGTATATLKVTGPGCVWLDKSTIVAAPDGADGLAISSDASAKEKCVKVAEGAERELTVRLAVPTAVNGDVNGTLRVLLGPDQAGEQPIATEVPFTAALQKPLNTTSFAIALIVALILGPLIPLLVLYLAKWLTSRIPGRALRAEQIQVRVDGSTVTRGGAPLAVRDDEFVRLVPGLASSTRKLDLGGIALHTRIGRSPFGTGYVVATAPGMAGAAGRSGDRVGATPDARLPLAVHNSWFVLHDPRGPENAATVVLLVGGDAGRSVIDRLVTEVGEHLPRVLPGLRADALRNIPENERPVTQPGPGNPFGGGGTGGGAPANPFGPPPSGGAGGFGPPPQQGPAQQGPPQGPPQQGPPAGGNPFGGNPYGPPAGPPSGGPGYQGGPGQQGGPGTPGRQNPFG